MNITASACLHSGLVLLLATPGLAPQALRAQGPPPPQVLQDGLIPSDLHDLYTALNLRPTPDAPLFATAPARAMEAYHYSWAGLAGDEAGFHEGEDFGTVRTLGPGDFRAIGRSQGRFGEVVVRQEETAEEGFARWVYYTYVDGRPMGMTEVLQPVASVSVAADGSEGTFVIEDPDGHTGSGYFARAGWKVEDGRTIHWIEGPPEPAFSATVLRYHEEGGEAVGHFLNSSGELLGVLRYDRAHGAGSFVAPGQNDDQPICWDAAMQDAPCASAEATRSPSDTSVPAVTNGVGDPIVLHHEASGMRITLPADTRNQRGRFDDGILGGRIQSVFPQEPPEDWNAVRVDFRPLGPVSGVLYFYALPAEGMDSEDWTSEDPETVKEGFGFQFTPDLEMDLAATYAGHEAIQFEARAGYGDMGTLVRHLMAFHEGMRFGVTVNVAYMLEYGDGRDKMEELVEWMENEVLVEIPR